MLVGIDSPIDQPLFVVVRMLCIRGFGNVASVPDEHVRCTFDHVYEGHFKTGCTNMNCPQTRFDCTADEEAHHGRVVSNGDWHG